MEGMLPVVETFHSLQGEGAHVGRSAYFIRLGGCKIGCPWCDTKISWESKRHPLESISQISQKTSKAQSEGAAFVVITGGEPLHHNLDDLCSAIRTRSKNKESNPLPIHIETSGVDTLSGNPDWITLSPKRHAPPQIKLLIACQELKVVIHDKDDLIFAEQLTSDIKSKTSELPILFLQPGWGNQKGHQLAFEYVKTNPSWRLSAQTHKWLKIR
tara:strand:+ start:87602 stop:88243 length:642 start_codon:yes stop_codon:yes gene_type:complete